MGARAVRFGVATVTAVLRIGDVFDLLAHVPDQSIDCLITSPPFLALRSYLPADHPDKHREIGSEATPADFLDTLLALTAEFGRVLTPSGSLCVELGDTYAGSGGGGGDYLPGGLREGEPGFGGSAERQRDGNAAHWRHKAQRKSEWPLAKSLTGIPTLYPWSLAYGRNLLTGQPSPAGQWRIRNVIVWARPNPPVGALADKFRPATSYITVACRGPKRFFDLDAVRVPSSPKTNARTAKGVESRKSTGKTADDAARGGNFSTLDTLHSTNGAPPLDWHADDHPEDGDWLWKMSTRPYKGSHYATFPLTLPLRLIEAMCPSRVCLSCGKPSERITAKSPEYAAARASVGDFKSGSRDNGLNGSTQYVDGKHMDVADMLTLGFTDCEHDNWRTGVVLDPFAGSGTTLEAATQLGRDSIGFDLDARNAALALKRVGPDLRIEGQPLPPPNPLERVG
jgi:site-specific DNA-methyltransferase (adenine-specific)